ncbi:uncharacterized protein BO97DRAFT_406413 [Aspergillus homomorphus CBS 101889]|uniref:LysM domain-containing protein n=1 Tax=Aspergillus homomorphus (strain CBS 101889) TaxID=1450537 RepID=A0A395HUY0_ASPHC|nr:hypothetical protein BO97DRAFT_406413 [Aspergillus homomorphus CBS 101889]RAL11195.1 hypothetical protein BO97DRAFT_406413 [Aspergillus homomorphus CBS 101889]
MVLSFISVLALATPFAAAILPPSVPSTPTTLVTAPKVYSAADAAAPTPTQPGIAASCNSFHLVASGDNCASIATAAGISLSDFYSWNSNVGSGCNNLWLGYYVCIGVGPTTTTTTTTTTATAVSTPTPVQTGMVSNCNAFYLVASGDTCTTVATKEGITVQNIVTWNPAVGTGCTNMWYGYYICVGVSG